MSNADALGVFACLFFRFEVIADDARVASEFAHVYASCASPEMPTSTPGRLELRAAAGGLSAQLDGGTRVGAASCNELLLAAMALIDGATVDVTADDLLLLHASAVMAPCGPVLLVGPSGAGKSTLAAAALARRGWAYLGDEVLGLDETASQLFSNPKPLKLDHRSRAKLFGRASSNRLAALHLDEETLIAPHELGPVVGPGPVDAPVAVVHVAFRTDARAKASPMSRAGVGEVLADQCFNFARWGARGLDTVAALARTAAGFRLDFGTLDGAIAQLEKVLG